MAELEVEQQRAGEANAIEHLGEMSVTPRLVQWTVGHNIRTIDAYRPEDARTR